MNCSKLPNTYIDIEKPALYQGDAGIGKPRMSMGLPKSNSKLYIRSLEICHIITFHKSKK